MLATPPVLTMMHCLHAPAANASDTSPPVSPTLFADGVAAYKRLPPALREEANGLYVAARLLLESSRSWAASSEGGQAVVVWDRVQLLSRGKGNTGDGMHRDGDGCFSCPPRILPFNAAGTRAHATTGRPC